MFRTVVAFAAAVALSLGAALPASADIRVGSMTTGSGAIVSGGSYLCPFANLGPGVLRVCQDVAGTGSVTVTAVAKPDAPGHWRFVRWDGFGCGSTATCTIATDGYFAPIAVFEDPVPPTLSAVVTHSAVRDRTVTLGWTANETASATCTLQGAPLPTCPESQSVTLPEGAYTFTAQGRDFSDNLGAVETRWFRILDTELVSAPPTTSNARTATFTVSSVLGTSFDCALDGRFIKRCAVKGADGTGTVTLPDLADGSHTLRVHALDGPDADYVPVTRTWTVDTVAPGVTLTPGADGTLHFASDEPTARFECQLDGAEFAPCASGHQPSVGPGEHRLAVRAVDRAGNVGAAVTHTWSVAAPVPAPPVLEPVQPRAKPAAISTLAGKRKVSKQRTVEIATVTCPAGATCAITTPKTVTVKIAGKRYTAVVTKTKTRVGLKLTKAAYAKLKGRTGSVTVTVGATATGASTTKLTVNATLRR